MEVEEIRKFIKSHYPDLDEILFFEMHQTEILLFEMAKLKSEELTKLKAENEELNEWTKTVVDRFNNLNGQHTQLKQENEELRKVKKDLDIQVKFKEAYLGHWQDSKEENTKLKERVKELLIKKK